MQRRFLVVNNSALPEPIQLIIDSQLVIALGKEDETKQFRAFNEDVLKYFKQNEAFMNVVKIFSKQFAQSEDWMLNKLIKGMMYQDPTARKLFIRRDWSEENGQERLQKYFSRYKNDFEENDIPSAICSCLFAAISGMLNLSDSVDVDREILTLILPIMSTPDDERIDISKGEEDANQENYADEGKVDYKEDNQNNN